MPFATARVDRSTRSSPPGRSATTSGRGRCSAVSQTETGCSGIAAMTPTGSEKRCRTRGSRLHPWPQATQDAGQIRQAPIQAAQPHRDHVRQAQGLEARGNPIPQMSEGLPLGHRARGKRHLLVMNPDPRIWITSSLGPTGRAMRRTTFAVWSRRVAPSSQLRHAVKSPSPDPASMQPEMTQQALSRDFTPTGRVHH